MTLVIGGTGKTGRRVAERLWSRGIPVRIGSRTAPIPFDWQRPATWSSALADVDAVYLAYSPDLAVPGTSEVIRAFSRLARSSGVRRIALLSGRGEPEAQRCEAVVASAGLEWAIVRSSFFNQNFSEGAFLQPILDGEVVLPATSVGEPFVDADDVADVAVAALTGDGHQEQVYEVTGPRLWTFAGAVAEIAAATGRHIRFQEVSVEEYAHYLERAGVPADQAALITYLFSEVLDGRNASVQDGVGRALGRSPRDFADYVSETAAAGGWPVADATLAQRV